MLVLQVASSSQPAHLHPTSMPQAAAVNRVEVGQRHGRERDDSDVGGDDGDDFIALYGTMFTTGAVHALYSTTKSSVKLTSADSPPSVQHSRPPSLLLSPPQIFRRPTRTGWDDKGTSGDDGYNVIEQYQLVLRLAVLLRVRTTANSRSVSIERIKSC
ncbi:hypothetical protein CPB84DRAFT_1793049 [Gymnopilus junonius]|uniref:Uncharacterized protein n=1 Tax=Gymnopilus junonius TaxID=109634 RepID=A0A9P5NCP3_GYMJU|nr:hypothetical protein CPB84DRAFT_1793049 [Gymnopilus junonius]